MNKTIGQPGNASKFDKYKRYSNAGSVTKSHDGSRQPSRRLRSAASRCSFAKSQIKDQEEDKINNDEFTDDENELFKAIEERIKIVVNGDEEAELKALKRLECLKKYLRKENKEILYLIKQKMTQELIETSTSKKDIIKNSLALKRLEQSLRIHGGATNALGYAKNFYSNTDQRRLMIEKKRNESYLEVKNDKELNIVEIDELLSQIIGISKEDQQIIENLIS